MPPRRKMFTQLDIQEVSDNPDTLADNVAEFDHPQKQFRGVKQTVKAPKKKKQAANSSVDDPFPEVNLSEVDKLANIILEEKLEKQLLADKLEISKKAKKSLSIVDKIIGIKEKKIQNKLEKEKARALLAARSNPSDFTLEREKAKTALEASEKLAKIIPKVSEKLEPKLEPNPEIKIETSQEIIKAPQAPNRRISGRGMIKLENNNMKPNIGTKTVDHNLVLSQFINKILQ